ncbi:glycoside hydrolase family 3 C-terminal domain-containing protein [Halosquirtibacter laminarini]|uniref:Glycoside hydrolase family 3 C-terminal domain-containing protein n=1 Tax=Halosquirtibacter laminarini TaxID=3374600 RepID=A0AC61NBH4_9BACT|nr:glycoside hydrolase family 3 C-terminal domain-containing protein [Prolixibacteraceae bacterium]
MKVTTTRIHILILLSYFFSACTKTEPKEVVPRIPMIEEKIQQMSIEEKVGQTAQITLDVLTKGDNIYSSYEPITLDSQRVKEALVDYHVGSILNTANGKALPREKWSEIIASLQEVAMHDTKSQVPILYGVDAIHGATYTEAAILFPQEISQAATWEPGLTYEANRLTAYQVRASGIPWTFSPVLDLGNDPRWARIWETYGEDPYLVTKMGEAAVLGYQGDDANHIDSLHVAACLKHFFCYASNSGKDRTPKDISISTLHDTFLVPFKNAIEKGALSVMINSGIINGIPVHANKEILTHLLKKELRFDGLVVTDWADIENLYQRDRVAKDHKEAICMAINAGVDLSMIPYDYKRYCTLLTELVKEKRVSMERLDDAVRRNLLMKYRLDLFDNPVTRSKEYPEFNAIDSHEVAYQGAAEAITLLKNQKEILPLSKEAKVFITGPNANTLRPLLGGWSYSWQGDKADRFGDMDQTILAAAKRTFGKNNVDYLPTVTYTSGRYDSETVINMNQVIRRAKAADYILLCLGENSYTEKPGDLHSLMLSENQQALALEAAKSGKPVILVLSEGRPRIIRNIEPKMNAIVQTYISGIYTANALMDILTGEVNPSGKLPYTYPMYGNSLTVYNHKHSEESKTPEGMYDYSGGFYPQYPFGFGLSYTKFKYTDLKISSATLHAGEKIRVEVAVKNVGERTGKEVVQLYTSDHYASITPDVKRLRAFQKIELKPNESKKVVFELSVKDISFVLENGQRIAEKGAFSIQIEKLKQEFALEETVSFEKL